MKKTYQYIRTNQAIVNALIALLKEKPFEKITVQDILDKAPVTRATFYAHFHDKYEIVEHLQRHFFQIRSEVQEKIKNVSPAQAQGIIAKSVADNKEMIDILLKIKTENVDLRETLAMDLANYYLEDANSISSKTESRIYAQARTEACLAFLYDDNIDYSIEYMNSIYLAVSLKLLKLSDDEETVQFLKKKLDL